MFDKGEDLEYMEIIDDAKMLGFDDLAKEFISELSENERFIYQIHVAEINKEFSAN